MAERALGQSVFSVSQINNAVAELLTHDFGDVAVEGEISRMTRAASGHWYFDMSDEYARISCVMFRGDNSGVGFTADVGTLVCARGRIDLYAPRGQYQFVVSRMEEAGAGALSRRFEELKKKLQAEGLFDAERKQPLPPYARRLGVLTSPSGAALHDVLRVLRRRDPGAEIVLYPIPVQGAGADREIVAALERAGQGGDCDLLLLVRGGGSAEDLSCFNSEALVRAIAACPLPIVSGIGHEIDFTLADFASDYRASTPSVAAEVASIDRDQLQRSIRQKVEHMQYSLDIVVANRAERLQALEKRLQAQSPARILERWRDQLQALENRAKQTLRREQICLFRMRDGVLSFELRLQQAVIRRHQQLRERLDLAADRLRLLDPGSGLKRGFAMVRDASGHILRDAAKVAVGAKVQVTLECGSLGAVVQSRHLGGKKRPS